MADKKISQLTAASTPLAGTEVLPIVQSGATVKVSIANVTAGRDINVNKITAADNVVIGTSGKGIDFSATAGTGTSELLNDYETGTWSPTGGNLTIGNGTFAGRYTKIGDAVYLYAQLVFGSTTTLSGVLYPVSNLPYAAATGQEAVGGLTYTNPGSNQYMGSVIAQGTNLFINFYALAGSVITPSGFNTTSPFTWGVDDIISFSIVYNAA